MPSVSTALATYDAKVAATTSATRMASDLRNDLEGITAGSAKYQRIHGCLPVDRRVDSNNAYHTVKMAYSIHHRLSGAESSYQNGAMSTAIDAMMDDTYWRVAGTAFAVIELELSDVSRVGNVVSYTITATVKLAP